MSYVNYLIVMSPTDLLSTFVHTNDRRYWGFQRHYDLPLWVRQIKDNIPPHMVEHIIRLGGGPNPAENCVITFTGREYIQYTRPQKHGHQDNHFFALEMNDTKEYPFGTVFFVIQDSTDTVAAAPLRKPDVVVRAPPKGPYEVVADVFKVVVAEVSEVVPAKVSDVAPVKEFKTGTVKVIVTEIVNLGNCSCYSCSYRMPK